MIVDGRVFQFVHNYRAGNELIQTSGNIWNVPKGMSELDIPATNAEGDALQAAVNAVNQGYSRTLLTEPQQNAIARLEADSNMEGAANLEARFKGWWVQDAAEEYVGLNFPEVADGLTWSNRGVSVIDVTSESGLNYDVHTDNMNTIISHGLDYPNQMWRAITYPSSQ